MHPTLVKKTLSTFRRLRLSPSPSTLRPKIPRYFKTSHHKSRSLTDGLSWWLGSKRNCILHHSNLLRTVSVEQELASTCVCPTFGSSGCQMPCRLCR
jgi:hypothetical protein